MEKQQLRQQLRPQPHPADAPFLAARNRSQRCVGASRSSRRRRAAGFTLIELMVVIMILGVLAALIVPRVMTRPDEARAIAARQDIAQIMQQLRLYRLDNGRYPTSDQGIQALVTRPTSGPVPNNWKSYLDKVPNDPWGKPYQYLNPGIRGEIDVFSLGADGQTGGTGADTDIGNWDL
jgi:general secretion pathway protein G